MKSLAVEDIQKELKDLHLAEREANDTLNRVIGAKMFCEKLLQDLLTDASIAPTSSATL